MSAIEEREKDNVQPEEYEHEDQARLRGNLFLRLREQRLPLPGNELPVRLPQARCWPVITKAHCPRHRPSVPGDACARVV